MKHSYFPKYFIICLQSIFSVVETVCCLPNINSCDAKLLFLLLYKDVLKITLYVYLFKKYPNVYLYLPTIYLAM